MMAKSFGVNGEGPVRNPADLRPAIERGVKYVKEKQLPYLGRCHRRTALEKLGFTGKLRLNSPRRVIAQGRKVFRPCSPVTGADPRQASPNWLPIFTENFVRRSTRPEETIDLGRAALTIALGDYPDLDIANYLRRIDALAVAVNQRCGAESDMFHSIAALNYVLFKEQGFRGNRDDYYDPKNSFLNRGDRHARPAFRSRLSVLYMEVAQRIGLGLDGVGFPGHFLVKSKSEGDEIVIDPFNAGDIKSHEDLADQCLIDLYGGQVRFHRDFLAPLPKKQILKRMLE